MAYLPLLLSLAAVDLLAAISPGPNSILVAQAAIHRNRRYAAGAVLGLATANLIWCLAVALGLSALFDVATWLYAAIRLAGGLYLIFLGVLLWRSHPRSEDDAGSPDGGSRGGAYLRGLLTNLSNPKSVVYFGSIFALFVGPGTPAWVEATAVAIVIFNTFLWYGAVAVLFSNRAVVRRFAAMQRPINRVAGVIMVGFGARLMMVHR